MYINLYPGKQLRSTKNYLLATGLFSAAGGSYALLRELFMLNDFRIGWATSSAAVTLAGFLMILVAMDKILLKDAYVSITPERVAYRLTLTGREHFLLWHNIKALQITEHYVAFEQGAGSVIKMRLGHVQQLEVAHHVSRSIMLAAMEKGIPVNGTTTVPQQPTLQV
ncbi:hypothetical protein ACXYMU_03700 [Pontibacter sp. CAU 1760]